MMIDSACSRPSGYDGRGSSRFPRPEHAAVASSQTVPYSINHFERLYLILVSITVLDVVKDPDVSDEQIHRVGSRRTNTDSRRTLRESEKEVQNLVGNQTTADLSQQSLSSSQSDCKRENVSRTEQVGKKRRQRSRVVPRLIDGLLRCLRECRI